MGWGGFVSWCLVFGAGGEGQIPGSVFSFPPSQLRPVTGFSTLTKLINHLLPEIQSAAVGPGRAHDQNEIQRPFFFCISSSKIGAGELNPRSPEAKCWQRPGGFTCILESQNQSGTEEAAGGPALIMHPQLYFIYLSPFLRAD